MIIVITYIDSEDKKVYVSHGMDTLTDMMVIMPNVPIEWTDAKFDSDIGEYVIE